MRTNRLCRNGHEGSPGDKHSTRVKVESGGNWQIQQDVERGWPRFTGWLELALAGEAIQLGYQWRDALTAARPLEERP